MIVKKKKFLKPCVIQRVVGGVPVIPTGIADTALLILELINSATSPVCKPDIVIIIL